MIRVGPAGWSYQDWEGVVYPLDPPLRFDPLVYLSQYFDTIEINNTFYRPPSVKMATSWAKRVEGNGRFRFTAKLFRNFSHDRDSLAEEDEGDFKKGIEPLMAAGRLGALLAQFPYSFHYMEGNKKYLETLAARFRGYPLILEVRHASWDRAQAYQFLREQGIGFCNIDQPAMSYSIGATKEVTGPVGYLRLHGRNEKNWFREGAGRDARYDYLYNEFEIFELTERMRQIAEKAEEVYVITNNHYRAQALSNALQIKAKLGKTKVSVPELLIQHYPELKEIAEEKAPP
jgi:uncharacterized protein YecE (DUF72 family)